MHTLTTDSALLHPLLPNLVLAWLWCVLGFMGGGIMGIRFQNENWLGGYSSFPRRLYRLGHISFFGLAIMNLLFFCTVCAVGKPGESWALPAWGFRIGAISMPLCCFIMAHRPTARPLFLFALPVGSLLVAGLATLWKVVSLL